MPLISVVVPVYNMEKFLPICIESILRQSIQDIEVILVDDGSTDTSGSICDAYSKQDSRVKVIHKRMVVYLLQEMMECGGRRESIWHLWILTIVLMKNFTKH